MHVEVTSAGSEVTLPGCWASVLVCALGKLCIFSVPPSPVCKFGIVIVTPCGVVLTIGLGDESAVLCIVFGTCMFSRYK